MAVTTPPKQYSTGAAFAAWCHGYEHGKAQCNHHPEALTDEAVKAIIDNERRTAKTRYNEGVRTGRAIESDEIAQALILLAQDFGSEKWVFTRADLEGLQKNVDNLNSCLARIETLR